MSQLDQTYIFDDSVAITVTRDSTNKMMVQGAPGASIFGSNEFAGNNIFIDILLSQAFAGGTSLQVSVFGSADDSTYDTVPLVTTGVIPLARLTLGNKFQLVMPTAIPAGFTNPKYIKLTYTVVGTMTTGKVVAYIGATRNAAT